MPSGSGPDPKERPGLSRVTPGLPGAPHKQSGRWPVPCARGTCRLGCPGAHRPGPLPVAAEWGAAVETPIFRNRCRPQTASVLTWQAGPHTSRGTSASAEQGPCLPPHLARVRPQSPASPRLHRSLLRPWLEAGTWKIPELKKLRKKPQCLHWEVKLFTGGGVCVREWCVHVSGVCARVV